MNDLSESLVTLLKASAAAQIGAGVLNLFLARLLHWKGDLQRMSLLPRQVFYVHSWFITLTLLIFGVLTWRFAQDMIGGMNNMAAWLAGGIALFWALRSAIQVGYYSSSHWRGRRGRTVTHVVLVLAYLGLAATYTAATWSGLGD